ncbi:hypothetical protein HDU83_007330 [Entophlyctis luteolus]|nr:hypothetical protein HDU83_007330 [Entophlyctis luteolus]
MSTLVGRAALVCAASAQTCRRSIATHAQRHLQSRYALPQVLLSLRSFCASPAVRAGAPAVNLKDAIANNQHLLSRITKAMQIVNDQEDWVSIRQELAGLEMESKDESLWESSPKRAVEVQKRMSALSDRLETFDGFKSRVQESTGMFEMARDESDAELCAEVHTDLDQLCREIEKYSMQILMSNASDKCSCFLEIRAGAGGNEACDWVTIISRMYEKWGNSEGYKVTILDQVKNEVGMKAVTLQVAGDYAYGWCKYETGVHRFVRISKFGEMKRQTSFVMVQVFPLDTDSADANAQSFLNVEISAQDIKMEVMRAQGAGGQHVNKTESAVRLTHIPSGIVVSCQNERSQLQNKAMAMQMLKSRLQQRRKAEQAQLKADAHSALPENAWGNQIKSYVMQPYQMIKDLRTGYERSDVDNVLDGDLQG